MTSSTAQAVADEMLRQSVQAGEQAPTVRGGDWHTAVVTAVASDGTVIAGGVTARRLDTYQPLVGDLIELAQASSGAWLARGRLVGASGDGWLTPTFASPWINYAGGGGFQTARYRRYPDGDVAIEGLVATGGTSVTGSSTVFTLPAGYRPQATQMSLAFTSGNAARQLEIVSSGVVRFSNLPAGAISFITINARFSTL
ncbi:hypothetical protein ASD97_25070 [Streptomyces sp. Root63]|uniref:hypothetical protein n=1 Tax=unclassified Streptomyces TaxID=2593676 RepID=UPI0006FCEC37|nr:MULTISPECIES: hypothetical protein [unclassified Streptomyces]KQX27571.1 hypothetical protein ASD29_30300 [Streptomyces sp. Root1295]KRA34811.1 hypothetical protein ASD97_25070 [Streptomyces sp. Root63]